MLWERGMGSASSEQQVLVALQLVCIPTSVDGRIVLQYLAEFSLQQNTDPLE